MTVLADVLTPRPSFPAYRADFSCQSQLVNEGHNPFGMTNPSFRTPFCQNRPTVQLVPMLFRNNNAASYSFTQSNGPLPGIRNHHVRPSFEASVNQIPHPRPNMPTSNTPHGNSNLHVSGQHRRIPYHAPSAPNRLQVSEAPFVTGYYRPPALRHSLPVAYRPAAGITPYGQQVNRPSYSDNGSLDPYPYPRVGGHAFGHNANINRNISEQPRGSPNRPAFPP